MGCMLRSDFMSQCDVYLQPVSAFETMSRIGEMGCVQFLDMNTEVAPQHKQYQSELCRCDEMERKLMYLEEEIRKEKMTVPDEGIEPQALQPNEMIEFENLLDKWEEEVEAMAKNLASLQKTYNELSEMDYVLECIGPMMGDLDMSMRRESRMRYNAALAEMGLGGQLIMLTGVVTRARCFPFEMMLWRITRGNIYYRQASQDRSFEDPRTGAQVRKVAFLAVCQGTALSQRMHKVCSGFRANLYPIPKPIVERVELITATERRIKDVKEVLKKTKFHRCRVLRIIRRQWYPWMVSVKKSKAIYYNLNLFNFDITKNCLIGKCWIPDLDLPRVHQCFVYKKKKSGKFPESFMTKNKTTETPPTYHRTNKFTKGFQALINAYGESSYRELNPGLYTIVTFPFLFALMFGDVGHGLIILVFALWMIIKEKQYMNQKSSNEIWNIFFGGRYVILLMGLFSINAGFIYNDCFSKAFNFGGSYWLNHYSKHEIYENGYLTLDPKFKSKPSYVYGIDPVWSMASNKIMVENSIKMKLSIIIGILHMLFGIFLSLIDHLLQKRYYAIFTEFIPQLLFMLCLFMWLVVMIFLKWFMYGAKEVTKVKQPGCAPQVLILFIDMVLLSESNAVDKGCEAYMFEGQRTVQVVLVGVAAMCVPILLLGTPLVLLLRYRQQKNAIIQKYQPPPRDTDFRRHQSPYKLTPAQEKQMLAELEQLGHIHYGEIMIHQGISTIEYVLGTVSHTASYLRLWALSLAHSELTHMLWDMIFAKALSEPTRVGCVHIVYIFCAWAFFTMSILVVMEGLSAFLHTLRLHWVEFMSKFFLGGGYLFHPFSFSKILAGDDRTEKVRCSQIKPKALQVEA